jgi:transposase
MLYAAAQSLLTHSSKWSWLKAWGMRVARRRGVRRAIVAVARRRAVVLHRMWVDGTEFRWSNRTTAVVAQAASTVDSADKKFNEFCSGRKVSSRGRRVR